MAVPVDNFESYSAGDLTGGNGGTGWDAAWSGSVIFDVSTTTPFTGSNCINATSPSGAPRISRTFTAISTDGSEFTVSMRSPVTNLRVGYFIWSSTVVGGPDAMIQLYLGSNGQIRILSDVTLTNIQAYSADTWYTIKTEITFSTEKHRISIDGGAYGSSLDVANSTFYAWASVDTIKLDSTDDVNNAKWDDIGPAVSATVLSKPTLLFMGVG